jgi:hypothetical protein
MIAVLIQPARCQQLADVVSGTRRRPLVPSMNALADSLHVPPDIKTLTSDNPKLVQSLGPAFERYNHEQYTTVTLPGASQPVCGPALIWRSCRMLTFSAGDRLFPQSAL